MENKPQNSPKSFSIDKGENTNFKANIQYTETVVKTENIEPQRLILLADLVWIKDENGKVRQTEEGTQYKVNIQDGQISFDRPLKFKK